MKQIKRYWVIALLGYSVISFSGCANMKEITKGVIGISTKDIEQARPNAVKKEFNLGYDQCYNKVLKALKEMNSYVYAKSKDMIAIYVSEEDTTAVGIFLAAVDDKNTRIEVSSSSTPAKEFISKKLFSKLEKPEEKQEAKEGPKAEAKPEAKPEGKPAATEVKKTEEAKQTQEIKQPEKAAVQEQTLTEKEKELTQGEKK